ncbi:MAG TPA: MBL fold metallo-hydrolase [bacterium]|nr:MBL fold metallo-hydrolase [bacterium]
MTQTRDNGNKWTFKWSLSAPTQDPFLLIDFENESRVLLFDCGVRIWGRLKTILKLEHLFITHAHIDHIIGFDHIVRSLLGESAVLHIHGPEGIIDRLSSKLNGYDWDRSAEQELILEINEYAGGRRTTQTHACNRRFATTGPAVIAPWQGPIVREKSFSVYAVPVDHGGSNCHAYVMKEIDYARIHKELLEQLGEEPGPWVGELLQCFNDNELDGRMIQTGRGAYDAVRLAEDLIRVQKGRTVVYITDTVFQESWLSDLAAVAEGADLVVCESTFLEEDGDLAETYHHLTSVQAARIARKLHADRLMLFHISSRYHPQIFRAVQEARTIFPNTDIVQPAGRRKPRTRLIPPANSSG